MGQPGEFMILDMGEPVKIADLAQQLIDQSGRKINIHYPGLRPREKLHEVLVATDATGGTRQHPRITHTAGSKALMLDETVELAASTRGLVEQCSTELSAPTHYSNAY